jgi:hypothetical protein
MDYKDLIMKQAEEIIGENAPVEEVEGTVEADDTDKEAAEYVNYVTKLAEEMLADDGVEKEAEEDEGEDEDTEGETVEAGDNSEALEKCATTYNEAQLLKQASEEAYLQAQAMEDAAVLAYNTLVGEDE